MAPPVGEPDAAPAEDEFELLSKELGSILEGVNDVSISALLGQEAHAWSKHGLFGIQAIVCLLSQASVPKYALKSTK